MERRKSNLDSKFQNHHQIIIMDKDKRKAALIFAIVASGVATSFGSYTVAVSLGLVAICASINFAASEIVAAIKKIDPR